MKDYQNDDALRCEINDLIRDPRLTVNVTTDKVIGIIQREANAAVVEATEQPKNIDRFLLEVFPSVDREIGDDPFFVVDADDVGGKM